MYVPKYKLAIEVDDLEHCTRNMEDEIERQEKIEQRLGCKFLRIDPWYFCKLEEHIIKSTKKSTKKGIFDHISYRLLSLEFRSINSIKRKCLKGFAKKYCQIYDCLISKG